MNPVCLPCRETLSLSSPPTPLKEKSGFIDPAAAVVQPGYTCLHCSIDGCQAYQVISRRKHQPWSIPSHRIIRYPALFNISIWPPLAIFIHHLNRPLALPSLRSVTRLYTPSVLDLSFRFDDPTTPSPVLAIWRPLVSPSLVSSAS